MTGKMRLYIGLLVLGLLLVGSGAWLLFNPPASIDFSLNDAVIAGKLDSPSVINLPQGTPVISEKLEYIMRGECDHLCIYPDGSITYSEEKGLRMPFPNPPTRTWKTGKLQPEQLDSLLEFVKNSGFEKLDEYYQFPGKPMEPIEGVPSGGFIMGDGSFTFSISYGELQKTVTAFGYLTPDRGETYPDMPYPLNEIYEKLKQIIENNTEEVYSEPIQS